MGKLPWGAMALIGAMVPVMVPLGAPAMASVMVGGSVVEKPLSKSLIHTPEAPVASDSRCIVVKDFKVLTPSSVIVRDASGQYYHLSLSGGCDAVKDNLDAALLHGPQGGAQGCLKGGDSFTWANYGSTYSGLDTPSAGYVAHSDVTPLRSGENRVPQSVSTCSVVKITPLVRPK